LAAVAPPADVEDRQARVEIHGMRGVRKIGDRKDDAWTDAEGVEVARVTADQPLLEFGHVGVSFAGDPAIYALTPKPPPDMPLAEVKRWLKAGEIFPGQILNDKLVFDESARRAAEQGVERRGAASDHTADCGHALRAQGVARGRSGRGGEGAGALRARVERQ
jgi:hypothetical protein